MTHPSNKRRNKTPKIIDRALRGMGEAPVQDAAGPRRTPRAKRLEDLRRRKAESDEAS